MLTDMTLVFDAVSNESQSSFISGGGGYQRIFNHTSNENDPTVNISIASDLPSPSPRRRFTILSSSNMLIKLCIANSMNHEQIVEVPLVDALGPAFGVPDSMSDIS